MTKTFDIKFKKNLIKLVSFTNPIILICIVVSLSILLFKIYNFDLTAISVHQVGLSNVDLSSNNKFFKLS